MAVFDVDTTLLIEEISKDLSKELQQPVFVDFVKTGTSRERAPQNRDWWFTRAASIFYRIYKEGPLGTGSLRTYYGGKKNRGVRPHKFFKAGGKVIRTCLQELEKAGYIKKTEKGNGRKISPKGQSYLNKKAKEVKAREKEIEKQKTEEKARKEAIKATQKTEEKQVKDELKKIEGKEGGKKKGDGKKKEKKDKKEATGKE